MADKPHTTILDSYLTRTPGSRALAARAEQVMPGGDTRAAAHHDPYPLTIARGSGPRLWDVDGNDYFDLAGNFTALVHGNAYPPIVAAAERVIRAGTAWPARNDAQIQLAEELCRRIESVEHVRFCNSGSEAAMMALQAARVLTNRSAVLMASSGFHGSHEALAAGSVPAKRGSGRHQETLTAPYEDAAAFEQILHDRGHRIAAVFLEPVLMVGGIVAGSREFFTRVRAATAAAGSLLVLDEVVTLRLARGGRQQELGVSPDITLLGKLIGGGFPVGAIGGSKAAMEVLDPRQGRMYHSGTFNGNPVTCAAGFASVCELTPERIDSMAHFAAQLDANLLAAAAEYGVPLSIRRAGSLLNIYVSEQLPPTNADRVDGDLMRQLHLAALTSGVFFAPRGMMALSTVMTEVHIEEVVRRMRLAFGDLAKALDR